MIGTADAEHAIWDSCCHALLMLIIDVQTIAAVQTNVAVQAVVTAVAHPLLMYVSTLCIVGTSSPVDYRVGYPLLPKCIATIS